MTLIRTLNKKIKFKTVTGPTSYDATNGWKVYIDEIQLIEHASIAVDKPFRENNYVYVVDIAEVSGNVVTLRVYRIDVTATAPSTWAEVPAATNISALRVTVIAIGH